MIWKLTKTEREIFEALGDTQNRNKLAEKFYVSLATIKTHLGNMYKKLQINGLPELVAISLTYKNSILEEENRRLNNEILRIKNMIEGQYK